MKNFFFQKRRQARKSYNVFRLIDHQFYEPFPHGNQTLQCICDIDKTYLETKFDTIFQMAKIAFWERPHQKITVPGATEILQAFRWGDRNLKEGLPRPLHFVSSSPPQLRSILRKKFQMDGLDWTSDTFKNQNYNFKKGRFDLFRHQTAYKTASIARLLKGHNYLFIGDSAEADSYIYLGLNLFLLGKISKKSYQKYLSFLGVESFIAQKLMNQLPKIEGSKITNIWIRNLSSHPWQSMSPLTDTIMPFQSYYEMAVFFCTQGYISETFLNSLSHFFYKVHNLEKKKIITPIKWFYEHGFFSKEKFQFLIKDWPEEESYPELTKDWKIHDLKNFNSLSEDDILSFSETWIKKNKN